MERALLEDPGDMPRPERVLIGIGVACILAALVLVASARWAEWRHAETAPRGPGEPLAARISPPTPTLEAPTAAPARTTPVAVAPTLAPTPAPSPTPLPDYGTPTWITIPSIALDNQVVEVGVHDGAYEASWWDIGHQDDSPDPGGPGNSVFNGHVSTLNAGHVFRNLKDVAPGDAIFVYSDAYRTDWSVVDVFSVSSDTTSFMDQTPDPQITLYTCDGQWNPFERRFADRLVVVAQLAYVEPR